MEEKAAQEKAAQEKAAEGRVVEEKAAVEKARETMERAKLQHHRLQPQLQLEEQATALLNCLLRACNPRQVQHQLEDPLEAVALGAACQGLQVPRDLLEPQVNQANMETTDDLENPDDHHQVAQKLRSRHANPVHQVI